MATTLKTTSLSVTITEQGIDGAGTTVYTVGGINTSFKRTIPVLHTAEIELYTTHADEVSGSQFDKDLVRYVRITNKDDENFVNLRLRDGVGAGDEFVYKLLAGQSFLTYSHQGSMSAADGATAGAPNGDIVSAKVQADTATVDVEILVVSA